MRYDPFYNISRKNDIEKFRPKAFFKRGYLNNYTKTIPPNIPFEIIKKYNTDDSVQNVISYSLYGNNPKYFKPLEDNIQKIKQYLPGWKMRVYLHDKVPRKIRKELVDFKIEVFIVKDKHVQPGNSAGAFWRFLPLTELLNVVI